MAIFSDNFERANGALGNNWVDCGNAPAIAGGLVGCGTSTCTYQSTVSDSYYQNATAAMIVNTTQHYNAGPAVKIQPTVNYAYWACLNYITNAWYLSIIYGPGSSTNAIASTALGGNPTPYYTLSITYDHGNLSASYNGTITATATHTALAANIYAGIAGQFTYQQFDAITLTTTTQPTLTAYPSVIGNYGTCTDVTLTGVGTAWTAGTPGTPTFTVNHGHISAQTVASTTSATITVCPDNYLGPITITDPSTGLTTAIVATSDPGTVAPPGAGDTWSPYATLVGHTGTYNDPDTLLTDRTPFIPSSTFDFGSAGQWPLSDIALLDGFREMYAAIVAQQKVIPPTADGNSEALRWLAGGAHSTYVNVDPPIQRSIARWLEVIGGINDLSLDDLYTAIGGIGTPDLSAVRGDLGVDGQSTYASILAALVAIRGDGTTDLATIFGALASIQTGNVYTLGDVLDAISGLSAPDLSGITTKLSQIQPSTTYNLSTLGGDLSAVGGVLDVIAPEIGGIVTTVAAIADVVDAIKAIVEAFAPGGAGGWPGEDNVDLGTAETLTNGLVLEGPMDGLLVTISGHPTGAGKYEFGDHTSWTHAGAVSFVTDRGDLERPDSIGLDYQIIVPRTMIQATSAIFRVNAGFTGTARIWTKKTGGS